MTKRSLWTRLNLSFLVGVIHPRILFHLHKLIANLQGSSTTKNRQDHVKDYVDGAFLDRTVTHASDSGNQHISRPGFLDNGYLRSTEGLAAFKKFPSSPIHPEYLECQLEGVKYFDKVIRNRFERHSSYRDIMIEHHRIVATGLEGTRNYNIRLLSTELSKDVAGKMRPAGGRLAYPIREKAPVNGILRALAEIDYYPNGRWDIQIDQIPAEAWSSGIRVRKGFDIVYPDGKYIPLFFSKMEEWLSLIKRLSHQIELERYQHRDMLLPALATYYQLGIHAHAFVRINQSLLMAQVNYILMLNHFRPVYHGYLDAAASFLDTAHFRNYFARHVLTI